MQKQDDFREQTGNNKLCFDRAGASGPSRTSTKAPTENAKTRDEPVFGLLLEGRKNDPKTGVAVNPMALQAGGLWSP